MQSTIASHHPKYRTKLCRNFADGVCPFGQKCSFLHPALTPSPSSFSLAQRAFSWNALLLPQLLALSNQQTTQNRRKKYKYPCRHFIRTGGWCPAAGQCKFQHDVAALLSAGIQKADCAPPFATDAHGDGGRTISGGVLMGRQSSSPLIVSRIHSDPQYTEAELMPPSSSTRYPSMSAGVLGDHSDQPVYWPNHTWQPYLPYYAAVPAMSISATAGLCSVAQQGVYPPSQPPVQTVPPRETQTSLPMGSYEVHGTTYFPAAPPPPPSSMPVHPIPFNPTVTPAYPYYAPPALHAGHYDIHNRTTDVGPQASFDPFASDRMMPSELPVIPRLEDYQMSPVQQDVLMPPLSSPSAPSGLTTTSDKLTATKEHEFPYRPLKDQRVGHARRISVNIKKHVRVNSG
ncbi:hypothetical protein L210DRAFT_3518778 [Boletus edulis BED1]|uniref:C3H1-type domain-containing protein n=1 Tax=Boletus edulis BED1 TaxID=1328754 RepID=A0AAD4GMA0_BOLED|nr:hypothetical protein L210DRAFT_3518778 [Boletus edulis BED1]